MTIHEWNRHFEKNRSNTMEVSHDEYQMSKMELDRITKSIQSFQLGESSEGKILKKQAKHFCDEIGSYDYLDAVKHLIREENRHSAYLAKFMDIHKIPKIKTGINDSIFRFIRRLMGVELSTRVLVTAEVIAITYYDCLGNSTGSNLLKQICQRMCDEELTHINFQMQHIHWKNFKKHTLFWVLANLMHYILFCSALLPVWIEHKKVLKTKYTFKNFCKKALTDFVDFTYQGQLLAAKQLVNEGFIKAEALCI